MKILKLSLLAALCALLLPAAAPAATPGVNIAGAPTSDRIQEALDTGAKTVRIFALWKDFEPDRAGQFPATDHLHKATVDAFDNAIRQLNAAGAKPLFVVTEAPGWANGGQSPWHPPADPAQFADFLGRFAAHNKQVGQVAGYEIWNEADEDTYWKPAPNMGQYAAMLKAAYPAIKRADASVTVLPSPTTGNNHQWVQALYDNGAGDSFDAVGVHTDTACLDRGPDQFYREDGKLARFTFLGYRSVYDVMVANGQGHKKIWMTELGWSSTNGGPTSCTRGTWKGQKPSGVSREAQAQYLTQAFQCMANDPYVEHASWFTMRDAAADAEELSNYGLLDVSLKPKPSYTAFKNLFVGDAYRNAGPCGDFDGPSIRIVKPAPGTQFADKLDVQAAATDTGVGLGRISFAFNGGNPIRNWTEELANDTPVGLAPWFGSANLPIGKHTIEVIALDKNGNTSTASVQVEKVDPKALKSTLTPKFKLKTKKVKCAGKGKKRGCKLQGSLSRVQPGAPSIGGKVRVEWQKKNAKGKWRKVSGGLKPANKAFTFVLKPKYTGLWRVRVVYDGLAPWKKAQSKFLTFRVK